MNRLTELLGIDLPILQAPIGSVAGVDLAAAVSRSGGLGALALTWTEPDAAWRLVSDLRSRVDEAFQVNFVLTFEPRSLLTVLEAGAPVITFSWGIPGDELRLVHSFGARCGVQISTAAGARQAIDSGADFLVCQGIEAGGHVQATRSLWSILSEIVSEAGEVPVVAAGGIASGQSVRQALDAGAAGAMLGTRFIATVESLAHPDYKQRLVDSAREESVLTVCFDLSWPYAAHRVLRSPTLGRWEDAGCPPSGRRPGEGDIVAYRLDGSPCRRYDDTPPLAGMTGRIDELCLFAGTGCDEINDIPTAEELVRRLWEEAQR